MRFAKSFRTSHDTLWRVVHSLPEADLGGGVFKFRIAREGQGTSGGARAIVAMKVGERVVLMYGFEKKDLQNISKDELKSLKQAAKVYLELSEEAITALVDTQRLIDIKRGETGAQNNGNA